MLPASSDRGPPANRRDPRPGRTYAQRPCVYIPVPLAEGYEAVRLLAEGKTNRVVCVQGDTYVDYDITEALKMKKGLDEQTYTVMRTLTGVE